MYTWVHTCMCVSWHVSFKWENTDSKDPTSFFKVKTAHQEPGSANQAKDRQRFFFFSFALKWTSTTGVRFSNQCKKKWNLTMVLKMQHPRGWNSREIPLHSLWLLTCFSAAITNSAKYAFYWFKHFLACLGLSLASFPFLEGDKIVIRRLWKRHSPRRGRCLLLLRRHSASKFSSSVINMASPLLHSLLQQGNYLFIPPMTYLNILIIHLLSFQHCGT